MNRKDIASLIAGRLKEQAASLSTSYLQSGPIRYFAVDNLLPEPLARSIAQAFPKASDMRFKNTSRERKYIAAQMNQYPQIVEEALFAFQEPDVVQAVKAIIAHPSLLPDPMLYAGGISRMEKGCYLNPHIDNSHDKDRKHWRALNLLYYISPGWRGSDGGNLELWPHGVKDAPLTLVSRFNRLVVMSTHQHSLHSVSRVHADSGRCCISNYYFSDAPMQSDQQFHVTSFRGRPEQPLRDVWLRADAALRMGLRRLKRGGLFDTGHRYEKP